MGRQLIERYTADKPRLNEHLDILKYICKDLWQEVFKKTIDNLRTNHRGTFVLKDSKFRWLSKLSTAPAVPGGPAMVSASELARDYLHFPCALIRGALCHLNVDATVSADASNLPAVDFTVIVRLDNTARRK